jgi:hypothetical protein
MSLIRFPLEDLIGNGPVRETEFRAKLHALDLSPYQNQAVLIPWIHNTELPLWVYLMVVAKLSHVTAVLSFGEACSPTVLWQNKRVAEPVESS